MSAAERELPRGARAVGVSGALLLRALGATWRSRVLGREHEQGLLGAGRPLLYAFWHGQLLPLCYLMRGHGVCVLVSEHRDGELITQVIHRLGYDTVRGSSTRGGLRSALEMARLGRAGRVLAITPDGPRGPRHRAQAGALIVAQRAALPIVPLACAVHPARQLASWDRFVVPAPFARIVMGFGAPLEVPQGQAPAALAAEWLPRIEEAINGTTAAAERALGEWLGKRDDDGFQPAS